MVEQEEKISAGTFFTPDKEVLVFDRDFDISQCMGVLLNEVGEHDRLNPHLNIVNNLLLTYCQMGYLITNDFREIIKTTESSGFGGFFTYVIIFSALQSISFLP